jgi:hypothetical protein
MRTVPRRRASGRYFHTAPNIFNVCFDPILTVEYLCGSLLHDSLDFRHDRIRISFIAFGNDFLVNA